MKNSDRELILTNILNRILNEYGINGQSRFNLKFRRKPFDLKDNEQIFSDEMIEKIADKIMSTQLKFVNLKIVTRKEIYDEEYIGLSFDSDIDFRNFESVNEKRKYLLLKMTDSGDNWKYVILKRYKEPRNYLSMYEKKALFKELERVILSPDVIINKYFYFNRPIELTGNDNMTDKKLAKSLIATADIGDYSNTFFRNNSHINKENVIKELFKLLKDELDNIYYLTIRFEKESLFTSAIVHIRKDYFNPSEVYYTQHCNKLANLKVEATEDNSILRLDYLTSTCFILKNSPKLNPKETPILYKKIIETYNSDREKMNAILKRFYGQVPRNTTILKYLL